MRVSIKLTAAAMSVLTLAIAAPVSAQPFSGGLARADINQDGALSRDEANQARREMFARLDSNADGQISTAELKATQQRIAAVSRMIDSAIVLRSQRMDSDGDGALSMQEFMAQNSIFDRLDEDGDGVASADEIAKMRARFQTLRQ